MAIRKTAREVVASGDVKAVIDYAVATDRSIKAETKELEVVKEFLRDEAMDIVAHTGSRSAVLHGNTGSATVVFPEAKAEPRKGVNLLSVAEVIDPILFTRFFRREVVVKPVDDFASRYDQLPDHERAVLDSIISIVQQTPRVTVK